MVTGGRLPHETDHTPAALNRFRQFSLYAPGFSPGLRKSGKAYKKGIDALPSSFNL